MSLEKKEADKFTNAISMLQKDFVVVGRTRVPLSISLAILGFLLGVTITLFFLVSQTGEIRLEVAESVSKEVGDHKALFHVSCTDVRRGQDVSVQPFTGKVANQFERRTMAEKRLFDCMWKSYRYVQALQKDRPELKAEIDRQLNQARNWAGRAIRRYQSLTVRTLGSPKNVQYAIGKAGYVWIYPPHGMGALRDALRLAPDWVAAHPNPDVLGFLEAKLENGKVVAAKSKPTKQTPTAGNKQEIMEFGVIKTDMKFEPLTPEILALLDEGQRLHTAWVNGVLERRPPDELQEMVHEHHEAHHALEVMSRSADERALLSINIHTPHLICWDRPAAEVDNMALELDKIHSQWAESVKNLDFLNAWTNGLRHSRLHAILATCGLKLDEVPNPKSVDLEGDLDDDLTAEELELVGAVEEEISEE